MAEVQHALKPTVEEVYVFWLAGMSCDGCSVSLLGATEPTLESLLNGQLPGMPKVKLYHPVLSVETGEDFMKPFEKAANNELDAPFVVFYEGSLPNEKIAAETGGWWAGLGAGSRKEGDQSQPISSAEWLYRMSNYAAAVIAIGTCATWGGIPASAGNPTDSMSLMDFLGKKYRSALGLPVINIPGCAPQGDNAMETVAAILLYLAGVGPMPEFDELGRPAWQFTQTVHRQCTRAGYYEEGIFADTFGNKECLVEIGCWGPVVNCNITKRGAINHMGGCMNVGGACIGCTMPGFPDSFSPFYTRPPGTIVSSTLSKTYGVLIRNLRKFSNMYLNKTPRWLKEEDVPSGWGHVRQPDLLEKAGHFFYQKIQYRNSVKPGTRTKETAKNAGND